MTTLRTWLKQQPHPAMLVATFGDESEKRVRVSEHKSKFRDAENALKGAVRVEALDAEGCTLRVWEAPEEAAPPAAQTPVAIPVTPAGGDLVAQTTAMMGMMTTFARLITEAADSAAARHAEAYQLNFQHYQVLLETLTTRLSQLESVWQGALIEREAEVDAAAARVESAGGKPPESDNDKMVTALLQAALPTVLSGAMGNSGGGSTS